MLLCRCLLGLFSEKDIMVESRSFVALSREDSRQRGFSDPDDALAALARWNF